MGVFLFMPTAQSQQRRFDWIGFLTLAIVIGCIQLILDRGEQVDWFNSIEVPLYFAISGSAIWMYIFHTLNTRNPILPPYNVSGPKFCH